ncbi:flagellar hook-associated protein FlgL [Campylobacter sp. LR291e]|uniref:flagellar hook-associated protein FlgL n=1 Tax=Campylobacter sp. LR291e TaxID=2593546 RepID=UPI00123A8853|nr:flagellar hook-associated protein FlgL [Campylobacter sp. LR291e]KAA6230438.1 flagellar hook-associated protein FlgL [Campylobacter sp. LR291e]
MRVTDKLNFTNSVSTLMGAQSNLTKISDQLSSGTKIQNSYEDASIYIDSTRLEYEIATITQVQEATSSSMEMLANTMTTLEDMVQLLENFKVKLTQAASDTNSQTSREAIASELELIIESFVQLANTSVNGQYLFSGSQVNVQPFDLQGNYNGDDNTLNVVTGAGTQTTYNITGWDLMYSSDSDYSKQITTNVSFVDNRYDIINNPEDEVYLDEESSWYQLIGQQYVQDDSLDVDADFEYDSTRLDYPASTLYVQGVRPDGTSFKSAVLIDSEDSIQDVLDYIGTLYGNTTTSKVVEVSINNSGQIQITDYKSGNNLLEFHAVAYTPQVADRTTLTNLIEAAQVEGISMDDVTNRAMDAALVASGGDYTILGEQTVVIQVNGQDFEVSLNQTNFIHSNMTDADGNATDGADYDNVYFEKDGNTVYGTVSQIIRDSSEYATDSTKLSEVMANDSLAGTTLTLNMTSRGGINYEVTIDLENSSFSYVDANNNIISVPIMNVSSDGTSGVVTASNDITYKQLNDIIALFASDNVPTASIVANNNQIDAADWETYQQLLTDSKATIEVNMDYQGRISVTDKLSTNTRMEIALYDSSSTTSFPQPPYTNTASTIDGSNFVFSANNAITIDEPSVDIIKDLYAMVDAVRSGNMRADSESSDPRNTGLQGALERIDHLIDHVSKKNTVSGTYYTTIEGVNNRAAVLKVNVQTMKSEVNDADYAETIINLIQTQTAYQASMKATTTLLQLSLLNYM